MNLHEPSGENARWLRTTGRIAAAAWRGVPAPNAPAASKAALSPARPEGVEDSGWSLDAHDHEVKLKLTMDRTINAKQLRDSLPRIVKRVRQGDRFTVLYRSRPAFRLVPVSEVAEGSVPSLADDPLYRASAVGASSDGLSSTDHDRLLYGKKL